MRSFVRGIIRSLIYFCFCFLEMLKSQSWQHTKVLPKPIASLTVLTEAKIELLIKIPPWFMGWYRLVLRREGGKEGNKQTGSSSVVLRASRRMCGKTKFSEISKENKKNSSFTLWIFWEYISTIHLQHNQTVSVAWSKAYICMQKQGSYSKWKHSSGIIVDIIDFHSPTVIGNFTESSYTHWPAYPGKNDLQ